MGPLGIMAIAWLAVAVWVFFIIQTNKKVHPKALFYLFFVELWERFSYYGMRALLVLYMIKGFLNFEEKEAYGVYAAYGALVYLTPLIGGLLAERYLGYRKSIMWGALLMALGHFAMAFENEAIFMTALALLILGNGFFKPNISSLIGKYYGEGDPRRDSGFTIFYMGINIGAFLTPLTCGAIGELYGWHYGFGIAGVGMLIGLVIFWFAQNSGALGDEGYPPEESASKTLAGLSYPNLIYIVSILTIPLIWLLVDHNDVVDILLLVVGVGMIAFMIYLSFQYEKVQRERLWVVTVLFLAAAVFWSFFELAGSAMTIFTDNNVEKNVFGIIPLTTTMFQAINPFFIILFAPIFSWMWSTLAKKDREPNAPLKFGIAMILLGVSFAVLNLGRGAAIAGIIPGIFIVLLYLFQTLGELALSPVGLSLVTKLSPLRIVGFVMGFWMLSSSIAHQAGKTIANMTAINSQEIVADAEFRSSVSDQSILPLLDAPSFQACLEDDGTIQSCVNSKEFAAAYSQLKGQEYFVATVANKAAYDKANVGAESRYKENQIAAVVRKVVTNDPSLRTGNDQPALLSDAQMGGLKTSTMNAIVQQSVSEKTLTLSLSVFSKLGFIAMGIGVLLILLSPLLGRWMHGIK